MREQTAREWMIEQWEKRCEGKTVQQVLSERLGFKCPTCGVIHSGIGYVGDTRRQYCSTSCYKERLIPKEEGAVQ